MIELKFETTISLDFWRKNKLRLQAAIPELKDNSCQILTKESFEKLLCLSVQCDYICADPVIEFPRPEEIFEQIHFFCLSSMKQVAMPDSAVEANWESLDRLSLQDRGGWAPISIPRELVYSTRLKAPRDIAWLAGYEFVVSEDFFDALLEIDPKIYGLPLYANANRTSFANGVKQLAVDQFSKPCVRTNSVIPRQKGFGRRDISGSNLKDSGVPVLAKQMLDDSMQIMRSSEPWDDYLNPGWIVTKSAAMKIARLSALAEFGPIFAEGTECHKVQEILFKEANEIMSKAPGARWSLNNVTPDFAEYLRKQGKVL
ncbi:MAG: hypothetical protein JJU31_07160 [Wenzhouxiangella sp.]|nr:hypothetical protein [Wenzhouxiangella sp.]